MESKPAKIGRNFIVCFDGTNNQFGLCNTNIVRIIQCMDRDHNRQRLYYDPGVGTLPEPNQSTYLGKKLSETFGLAFGLGISRKVCQAYAFLMNNWEPGDNVFIFGFSRGAHSARVLAGMLHAIGLLPKGCENMVPYAMRIYSAIPEDANPSNNNSWLRLCDEFRWSFAKQITKEDDERRFFTHFLGLFDTVSTIGWIWNPTKFGFTNKNPSVRMVRHAIAIDERRAFFNEDLFESQSHQDVQELWFPGVHSDVGGGYAEGNLWQGPFRWMVDQAIVAGFILDQARYQQVLSKGPDLPRGFRHESLKGFWWLAEYFPKIKSRKVKFGLGQHRLLPKHSQLAQATQDLYKSDQTYRPTNVPENLILQDSTLNDPAKSNIGLVECLPASRG